MQQVSEADSMKTLSECSNKLVADGFSENFKIDERGRLFSPTKKKTYAPEKVHIVNFFRFEGASDPDENAILYAIETDDGLKGMLTDAYGTYADPMVSKFIQLVEDISKKNPKPL